MSDFSGRWFTTFGAMNLTQSGNRVEGTYGPRDMENGIEGVVKDGVFQFHYREPDAEGEGWFALERHGKFNGQWRPEGLERWGAWTGQRGFDGIWDSNFGPIRLIQEQGRIWGTYEGFGNSSIDGRMEGERFVFRYQEPAAQGEGWFQLTEDALHFDGQWRPVGAVQSGPWQGRRWRGRPRRAPWPGGWACRWRQRPRPPPARSGRPGARGSRRCAPGRDRGSSRPGASGGPGSTGCRGRDTRSRRCRDGGRRVP